MSPATAAYYINWAEYLSWRNPIVASYDQYLLADPPGHYPFSSGLETSAGKKKATYNAFRHAAVHAQDVVLTQPGGDRLG